MHSSFVTTETIIKEYRKCLMGISMVSIVLFHQRWFYGSFFDFFHNTGHLGVDMFLFLSGWGIQHSLERNSTKQYLKNRFVRLIPSCIIAGWLQIALDYFGIDGIENSVFQYVFRVIGLFKWYVIAIIVYYILAPFVFRLQKRGNYMPLLIGLSVVFIYLVKWAHLFNSGGYIVTTVPFIFFRLPAFLLGMRIAHIPFTIKWSNFFMGSFAYFVALLFLYEKYSFFLVGEEFVYVMIMFSFPFLLYVLYVFFQSFPFMKYPFDWIGAYTLEIYLWHEFLFHVMMSLKIEILPSIQFGLSLLLTALLSIITNRVSKIRFIR